MPNRQAFCAGNTVAVPQLSATRVRGCWLHWQVTVHYPLARNQLVTYKQAFTGPTTRHCCNCFKPVEGCSLPQDAVLQGGLDLFCSLECERLFYTMNSSSE